MSVYFESRINRRNINQDRYYYMEYRINHEAMLKVFLVADGMGGLSRGEKASALACEKWLSKLQTFTLSDEFLGRTLSEQMESLKRFFGRAVKEINEEVYRELLNQGIEGGTTLTGAILFWDTLMVFNCGDSPAYLLRDDRSFLKLTKDQNVAEELFRQGKITKDSQTYRQKKHMLTDYIGKYRAAYANVLSLPYQKGDLFLLGSDGAFGSLREEELRSILLEKKEDPQQIIKTIFQKAEEMGEEDNQTMIVFFEEKDKKEENPPKKRGFFRKRQAV